MFESTRAHQKTSTYESTLRFLFCSKTRLTGRVDSNSCGDVAEDGAKTVRCNSDDRCQRQMQGGTVGAAAVGSRDPGSFLFRAAREIHENCANKNHRPGGWWFGDREKTGFISKRAGRRRGQRASACWILAKSSSVRASGRMRASNPAASMAAVTASFGIPRPLAMALAAVLRR